MELSKQQISFILDNFFTGAPRTIGEKLLKNGTCIVAGKDKVAFGGAWNFVDAPTEEDTVDCLRHTLDKISFLSSSFFKDTVETAIEELNKDKKTVEEKIQELSELL
jgi:hypothetical protein